MKIQDEPVGYRLSRGSHVSFISRDPDSFERREYAIQPLYARPDNSKLRKAAEELLDALPVEYNKIEEVINLRAALDRGES